MLVATAGNTVSSYSELLGMTPEFGLRGVAQDRIPSNDPMQAGSWPRGGFRLASIDSRYSEAGLYPAALGPDDVTGSLPKPAVLDRGTLNFPRVNRQAKADRKPLPAPVSRHSRSNFGLGETSGLNPLFSGQPTAPGVGVFQAPQHGPSADRPGQRRTRTAAALRRDKACLAKGIYFEARGETRRGQLAVAQVIMNRVDHWFYPNNVCDVVFQNQHRRNKCQFSFACDGRSDRARDRGSWRQAVALADKVLSGEARSEDVGTQATHYHASYVRPRWIRDMIKIRRIGTHIFYRVRKWS